MAASWKKILHESSAAADFPTLNQSTTGSAATLTTARNFSITGDVTASAVSFNGSGAVALATSLASGVVDATALASNAVTNVKISDDAVDSAEIKSGAVDPDHLAGLGSNGTAGQVLQSDGDGTFSWASASSGDVTGIDAGTGITINDGSTSTPEVALNAAQTGITSIYNSSLAIGAGSGKARMAFGTADINFGADASHMTLVLENADATNNIDNLRPKTDRGVNLGTSSNRFNEAVMRTAIATDAVIGTIKIGTSGSNTAITATAAELNYVDGVTSNIQTQLNGKAAVAGSTGQNFSTNDLNVNGNLTVSGTTTTINTATLTVEDKLIKLADVSSPTTTTANGAGIQLEVSATEAEFPELKWDKDGKLTGWTLSDYKGTSNEDVPVSVMKFGTSAPSGQPDAGQGTFFADASNNELYIYV